MRFSVMRSSDTIVMRMERQTPETVELSTLEELLAFVRDCGYAVIIDASESPPALEINDGYE